MVSDDLEKLNKDLLIQKLKDAKRIIDTAMTIKKLNRENNIAELWKSIDEFIGIFRTAKHESRKRLDLTSYFLRDTQADHVAHIQRDVIMTVMLEDHLQLADQIEWLIKSIEWRINSFNDYWNQMNKGVIKNPYLGG